MAIIFVGVVSWLMCRTTIISGIVSAGLLFTALGVAATGRMISLGLSSPLPPPLPVPRDREGGNTRKGYHRSQSSTLAARGDPFHQYHRPRRTESKLLLSLISSSQLPIMHAWKHNPYITNESFWAIVKPVERPPPEVAAPLSPSQKRRMASSSTTPQ